MEDLHKIQMQILRELIFHPNSRFTDLNTKKIDSDHFKYHLKKLVELGLIERREGRYFLTQRGKVFAGKINTEDSTMTKQAKISVLYCGIRTEKQDTEYLIQVRKKEPFYGYMGFGTGKIKYTENISETAKREMFEETGLMGEPEFIGILHFTNKIPSGELLEDRILFVFKILNPRGNLIGKTEEAESKWMTEDEVVKLNKKFPGFDSLFEKLKDGKFFFSEEVHEVDGI